jgi:competence ComEA-like helix-hairpin-helix protein
MSNASISKFIGHAQAILICIASVAAASILSACSRTAEPIRISENSRHAVASADAVDINSATVADLEKIPRVGRKIAERIISHREKYGPFKRPEQLMLIQGISESSFREMRHLIRTVPPVDAAEK